MANTIKSLITFTNVPAGGSQTLPHNIKIPTADRAIRPDIAIVTGAAPTDFSFVNVGQDQITATNNGSVAQSVTILCEYWHTLEREFGATATVQLQAPTLFVYSGTASTASCGVTVAPGNNKAAEINAAITQMTALFAADGRERLVQLQCGTYTLETSVVMKSGVTVQCDGNDTILVPTFAGAADDPLNAVFQAVGAQDLTILNTTLAATAGKGVSTITVTAIGGGTVKAGDFLLITGSNAGHDGTGELGSPVLWEIVKVDASYAGGVNIPLLKPLSQLHGQTVQVVGFAPVRFANFVGGQINPGTNPSVAVGILYRGTIDSSIRNVRGQILSRALINIDQGTRDCTISEPHGDGQLGSLVFRQSVMDVDIFHPTTSGDVTRLNALGVPRGLITSRSRCTNVNVHGGRLDHGGVGLMVWGDVTCGYTGIQISDMDASTVYARLVAAAELQNGDYLGSGKDGDGVFALAEAEWGNTYSNINLENIVGAALIVSWYASDDNFNVHQGFNLACRVDGSLGMRGIQLVDSVDVVWDGVATQGIQAPFWIRGQPRRALFSSMQFSGSQSSGGGVTTGVFADTNTADLQIEFRGLQVAGFSFPFTFGGSFIDTSLSVRSSVFSAYIDFACPARDNVGVAYAIGDVLQFDGTSPVGSRYVIAPTGPNNKNCVIVAMDFASAVAKWMLVGPLPQTRAFVNATTAAVSVGDNLVSSATTPKRAETNAKPGGSNYLGLSLDAKAGGAGGFINITMPSPGPSPEWFATLTADVSQAGDVYADIAGNFNVIDPFGATTVVAGGVITLPASTPAEETAIHCSWSASSDSTVDTRIGVALLIDGVIQRGSMEKIPTASTFSGGSGAIVWRKAIAAGAHTYKFQARATAGNFVCEATSAPELEHMSMIVREMR